MHFPRFSSWCSGMQGLYARLTGEDLYMQCSGFQGIYAQLTGEDLYIWCSGIQGIYARLCVGGSSACYIYAFL